MLPTARVAVLSASMARDRRHSPWTRTVAVIRIPRFKLLRSMGTRDSEADDPLAAFAKETDLLARRQARR